MAHNELPAFITYFPLMGIAFAIFAALAIRYRGQPLVTSGRVTSAELSGFTWGILCFFGGWSVVLWILQRISMAPTVMCLMRFPPQQLAGLALWLFQLALSAVILWWIWTPRGGDLFARLIPALLRGPVLDRTYSAGRIRLVLTALLILGPLGNITMQVFMRFPIPGCGAI
jgi:hypothetical protein